MKESRRRVLLFGTDEVVAETLSLRSGPLDLTVRGARVGPIRCGDAEVWHGIAFLFRDVDWGTPEPIVEHTESTISESAFLLRATGRFPTSPVIDFRIEIEGTFEGCVRYSAEAVAGADIATNRLGVCLMHPMSAGGSRVEIEHIDGRVSRSTFPTLIPPWPPFMLIRAIRHEYARGRWAHCVFAGDSFELEDQRNNSDSSFKTYSRSNLMSRPYWLRAGIAVRQSVELRLDAPRARSSARRASVIQVSVGNELGELPRVGIEIAARDALAGEPIHAALRALGPAHLHLALDANAPAQDWSGIKQLLASAGAQLRLDVTVGDLAQAGALLEGLRVALRAADLAPASIAIFPSEQRCIDAARRAFPAALIGGGTPDFFVQLNRLEALGDVDFLTFTTSPIVHGADDDAVMLTLQSLPSMIETLRARFSQAKLLSQLRNLSSAKIAVGPSTIAVRRSPLGKQPESDGLRRVALARQDPRCRGLYGAAWLLGYVAQLASAGVDTITLMSLTGASGVLALSEANVVTMHPTYFALERLRASARVRNVSVSDPSRIAAIALRRNGNEELLLANLSGDVIDVRPAGIAPFRSCAILDAAAWEAIGSAPDAWTIARRAASGERIRLEGYAIASLLHPA